MPSKDCVFRNPITNITKKEKSRHVSEFLSHIVRLGRNGRRYRDHFAPLCTCRKWHIWGGGAVRNNTFSHKCRYFSFGNKINYIKVL